MRLLIVAIGFEHVNTFPSEHFINLPIVSGAETIYEMKYFRYPLWTVV